MSPIERTKSLKIQRAAVLGLLAAALPLPQIAWGQDAPQISFDFAFDATVARERIASSAAAETVDPDDEAERVVAELVPACNDRFPAWDFVATVATPVPVFHVRIREAQDGGWFLKAVLLASNGDKLDHWSCEYLRPGPEAILDLPIGKAWADLVLEKFEPEMLDGRGLLIEQALKDNITLIAPGQVDPAWRHLAERRSALPLDWERYGMLVYGSLRLRCDWRGSQVKLISGVECNRFLDDGPPPHHTLVVKHITWNTGAGEHEFEIEQAPFEIDELQLMDVRLFEREKGIDAGLLTCCEARPAIVAEP